MSDAERLAYENGIAVLRGERLTRVRYVTIDYGSMLPYWRETPVHMLDFGVEVETDSGAVYAVTWGKEFLQYGLSLLQESLTRQIVEPAVWDVTDSPEWAAHLHRPVVDTRVYWSWCETHGLREHYPQDIMLTFDGAEPVFFSASDYDRGRDSLIPMADAVTVLFGCDAARRYEVGPFDPTQAV